MGYGQSEVIQESCRLAEIQTKKFYQKRVLKLEGETAQDDLKKALQSPVERQTDSLGTLHW